MAAAVIARTVIGIDIAVAALVAIVTGAAVAVDFISARACVLARAGEALVDISAAVAALVSRYATAAIAVAAVRARACVLARAGEALVDVYSYRLSFPTCAVVATWAIITHNVATIIIVATPSRTSAAARCLTRPRSPACAQYCHVHSFIQPR